MNQEFEEILDKLKQIPNEYRHEEYNEAISDVVDFIERYAEKYNNGWIPCSERLPECGIKVLVQYGCGRINIEECKKNTDGIIGFYDGNYWSNADNYSAWQPLPEPFKER